MTERKKHELTPVWLILVRSWQYRFVVEPQNEDWYKNG